MDEPTLSSLVEELERVKQENKRWKRINLTILLCITGLALILVIITILVVEKTLSKARDVVEAEKFVLVDSQGNTRALLQADSINVNIQLLDRKGNTRVALSTTNGRSELVLSGVGGFPKVWLDASGSSAGMALTSKNSPFKESKFGDATIFVVDGEGELWLGHKGSTWRLP